MKTEQELNELSVPELKAYIAEQGYNIKGNLSKETLVDRIVQVQDNPNEIPAVEPDLEGGHLVPESLELVNGEYVKRSAILQAVVRDLDMDAYEWNKLSDKEKDRKIKGFIDTLDLKQEEPEEKPTKADKGSVEHAKELLQHFIDRGLKIDFDGNVWEMSYGPKIISGNLSYPGHVLVSQARSLMQ